MSIVDIALYVIVLLVVIVGVVGFIIAATKDDKE
jgi:hypothetical protein